MDLYQEESNLIYDDIGRGPSSPRPHEESEDEDQRREVEEMLYSRVYYDDSSINTSTEISSNFSALDGALLNVKMKDLPSLSSPKYTSSVSTSPITVDSNIQLPSNCARSEFNNPGRKKPSRYFDADKEIVNTKHIFATPCTPGQKRTINQCVSITPSQLTMQIMARSDNELSFYPNSSNNVESSRKDTQRASSAMDSSSYCSNLVSVQESEGAKHSPSADNLVKIFSGSSSGVVPVSPKKMTNHPNPEKEESSKKSQACKKRENENSLEVATANIQKKRKEQSFEAKVSKVLSSMLDEESRSSLEENQSASTYPTQSSLNSSAGWGVGMSWSDMSSKFSFGVDSIEEESVSSLQLRDDCNSADGKTNTLNTQEKVEDGEQSEQSKYDMELKNMSKSGEKKNECAQAETDSESEVGSVVEVAPPLRPEPLIVDLSDGEYTPELDLNKTSKHQDGDEVKLLFSKNRHSSRGTGLSPLVIESSSDDDLIILDELHTSAGETMFEAKKSSKRQNSEINERNFIGEASKSAEVNKGTNDKCPVPSKLTKEEALDRWLLHPIKASKHLDHRKLLRNMSDDPKLWRICADDVRGRSTPRSLKCTNCNDFGHKAKFCKSPKKITVCCMCGSPGHKDTGCSRRMCLTCGNKTNVFVARCQSCRVEMPPCKLCCSKSHPWRSCPDWWRRYHLTTTSSGEITVPPQEDIRPPSERWCSNCASNGHLSHECKKMQWKNESINPYIISYLAVSEEERRLEGPNGSSGEVLLTEEASTHLKSSEGKEFLKMVSEDCQVAIHFSHDTSLKKLVMEGTSSSLQKAQSNIYHWVVSKNICDKNESNISDGTSDSANDHRSQKMEKNLGKREKKKILNLINNSLKKIENRTTSLFSVKQLLETYNAAVRTKEKGNRFSKQLNTILLGQCGFANGFVHIENIKKMKRRLMEGKDFGRTHKKRFMDSYIPVFTKKPRKDYEILVKKFYANKDLVWKYDRQIRSSRRQMSSPLNEESAPNVESLVQSVPVDRDASTDQKPESSHSVTARLDPPNKDQEALGTVLERIKNIKKIVPAVIKNLTSRFIFCQKQKLLTTMFESFCKESADMEMKKKIKHLELMEALSKSLCKSYNIRL